MTSSSKGSFVGSVLRIVLVCLFAHPLAAQSDFYRPPIDQDQLPLVGGTKARNVILLIGDGMSVATISGARIHATGSAGVLHMDRMPVAGFVRTSAANALVTDSAASSTAMATGMKTDNGVISMTPDGRRLTTVLELSRDRKMATGLVATSSLTHATPAGFAAHVKHRSEEPLIAEHLLESRVNVLLGGGRAFFTPATEAGSKRIDSLDLISQAQRRGYAFVDKRADLLDADSSFLLGLFSLEGMLGVDPEPSLPEMTEQALRILSRNRDGFLLVVEGSQIDWANHNKDWERACQETLWFDLAVKKALDFAVQDKKTLVIVTADHETGGMAILGGNLDGTGLRVSWGTGSHAGATVPLYAYGPGALKLSGFRDNTEIARVIAEVLGLRGLRIQPKTGRLTRTVPGHQNVSAP
jgi:alkaline phosphatase